MLKSLRKAAFFIIFFLLLSLRYLPSENMAAAAPPSVDFSVKPSASQYIKSPNGNAEGSLNVSILPKGMASNEQRKPIQVFFVHDTSGSMSDTFNGARKDTTAKAALSKALDFFWQNAQQDDQYYFIPFDSNISDKSYRYCTGTMAFNYFCYGTVKEGKVTQTQGIDSIKSMLNGLDLVSGGGTNYSQPLESILTHTSIAASTKKYVILLTDGEPTSLQRNETFTYRNKAYSNVPVTYTLYTNHTASKVINSTNTLLSSDYNSIRAEINRQALLSADTLAANNITMYSLAFAQKGDVNYQLLDTMSAKTGGYAVQGETSNLSDLFSDISSKFDAPSINGEVTIDLSRFNGTVKIKDGSGAYVDSSNVAHLRFNFSYPINKSPTPNETDISLPLTFSQVGKYTFDNIQISYTDLNGQPVVKKHDPVIVNVTNDSAPSFDNSVELGTVHNPPESLIKQGTTDSELNQFMVNYTLTPTGLINKTASGTLSSYTINQPLPPGISLASTQMAVISGSGFLNTAKVQEAGTGANKSVKITIPASIAYSNNAFDLSQFSFGIKLKADWAQSSTTLPNAVMQYTDSRFGQQTIILNNPSSKVNMKVSVNDSNFSYTGDYSGKMQKVSLVNSNGYSIGQVIAETEGTAEHLQGKPVMGMEFVNDNKAVKVTYNDSSSGYLYFRPDFVFNDKITGNTIVEGSKTEGPVEFKVTDLVAGKNVKYEYKIASEKGNVDWTELDPNVPIQIPDNCLGNVSVSIRTSGGFTVDQTPINKSLVIQKLIKDITVTPNPLEVDKGSSIHFNVAIIPSDALNQDLTYTVENIGGQAAAVLLDGNNAILGKSAGTAELVVTAADGSGVKAVVPITVKDPRVNLESIQFTQAKYTLSAGDTFNIDQHLIFNPSNASDKGLKEVISANDKVVTIIKEADGTWSLKADQPGYATIKAVADENPKLSDTAVIQVNPNGSSSDGSENSTDGKW